MSFVQLIFGPVFLGVFFLSSSITSDMIKKIQSRRAQKILEDYLTTNDGCTNTDVMYALEEMRSYELKHYSWSIIYQKAIEDMSRVFLFTYVADVIFWPPLQAINFSYIPLRYQVLYMNSASCVWNIFLSYMANSKHE